MTGKYVSKRNQFVFIFYPLYFLLNSPCTMSGLVQTYQVLSCAEQSPGHAQLVHPVHPQYSMGNSGASFFLHNQESTH